MKLSVKQHWAAAITLSSILTSGAFLYQKGESGVPCPIVKVAFDDITSVVVNMINLANKSIDYQMYNFTSPEIGEALCEAAERGVKVRILLDWKATHTESTMATECAKAGCEVRTDKKHQIAHNKVRIIDDMIVLGGSFNDTTNAEKHNAENVTIVTDPLFVAAFAQNFRNHWAHSDVYVKWIKPKKETLNGPQSDSEDFDGPVDELGGVGEPNPN